MADVPHDLDHSFTVPIGVNLKGETWPCVEMPGSRRTRRSRS